MDMVNISRKFTNELLDEFLDYQYAPGKTFRDIKNLARSDYMSWSFAMSYVNNFNYTIQKPTCAGYDKFDSNIRSVRPAQLYKDKLILDEEVAWRVVPFSIVVGGQGMLERMTVTDVALTEMDNATKQVLTLLRSNDTIDGLSIQSDIPSLAKPPSLKSGWFCPLEWYGNGQCNCECGGVDIDCVKLVSVPFTSPPSPWPGSGLGRTHARSLLSCRSASAVHGVWCMLPAAPPRALARDVPPPEQGHGVL